MQEQQTFEEMFSSPSLHQKPKQIQKDISYRDYHFSQMKCSYTNVNIMEQSSSYTSSLLVSNFLAKQQNGYLIKTTEIRFEDKVIVIQDKYQYTFNSKLGFETNFSPSNNQQLNYQQISSKFSQIQQSRQESQYKQHFLHKQKKIFKKKKKSPILQNNYEKSNYYNQIQKRDTKNVARNICRWFLKFLHKNKDKREKKLNQLIGENGFNNMLVQNIIKSQRLTKNFKEFLQNQIKFFMEKSKIMDKKSHKQAIEIYLERYKQNEEK